MVDLVGRDVDWLAYQKVARSPQEAISPWQQDDSKNRHDFGIPFSSIRTLSPGSGERSLPGTSLIRSADRKPD